MTKDFIPVDRIEPCSMVGKTTKAYLVEERITMQSILGFIPMRYMSGKITSVLSTLNTIIRKFPEYPDIEMSYDGDYFRITGYRPETEVEYTRRQMVVTPKRTRTLAQERARAQKKKIVEKKITKTLHDPLETVLKKLPKKLQREILKSLETKV